MTVHMSKSIVCGRVQDVHCNKFIQHIARGQVVKIRSLADDGRHGLVEGHDGLQKLTLDLGVIHIFAAMISEGNDKSSYPPIELTRFLIFYHNKLI